MPVDPRPQMQRIAIVYHNWFTYRNLVLYLRWGEKNMS